VAELPLDHVQRNSLARHLDGVGMAQLVRREPTPHPGLGGETAQLRAGTRLRPLPPAGRAVDDAEQRPCRQLRPLRGPRAEVFPAPVVHPDLATAAALALAHQERAAARIEVTLVEVERLLDPEPGAPENNDQSPGAVTRHALAGHPHDGDDLLDVGRVGRIAPALVAGRATQVEL
jgi:hypothetical protein